MSFGDQERHPEPELPAGVRYEIRGTWGSYSVEVPGRGEVRLSHGVIYSQAGDWTVTPIWGIPWFRRMKDIEFHHEPSKDRVRISCLLHGSRLDYFLRPWGARYGLFSPARELLLTTYKGWKDSDEDRGIGSIVFVEDLDALGELWPVLLLSGLLGYPPEDGSTGAWLSLSKIR